MRIKWLKSLYQESMSVHRHAYALLRNGSETADSVYFIANHFALLCSAVSSAPLDWWFVYLVRFAETVEPPKSYVYFSFFASDGVPPELTGWFVLVCFWPNFGVPTVSAKRTR